MKKRESASKIAQLKSVYTIFEEVMKDYQVVCKEKCASCCTCNVTMTSLEADLILYDLNNQQLKKVEKTLVNQFPEKRYTPKITTNQFARLCIEGKEIPEEKNDPSWGKCPLLEDDLCTIYEVRPFGCRALISEIDCKKNQIAQIPPIALTINNVFLQAIEHMDKNGYFGNLTDILGQNLQKGSIPSASEVSTLLFNDQFLLNEKITSWMVPPEHLDWAKLIFERLREFL
jgi:Fe-S-cluster containining protein